MDPTDGSQTHKLEFKKSKIRIIKKPVKDIR